ncbi:hypothetical protein RND81_04G049100 [Saponaria officinalis]|uniref:MULE transposase domain-containing protein n=1 Tax=Saponaria officinalis TaxID=3572 RepID=A0AAW1LJL1_SAPOF
MVPRFQMEVRGSGRFSFAVCVGLFRGVLIWVSTIGPTQTYRICKEYVDGYSNIGVSLAAFKNFQRDVKGFIGNKDGQLFVDTLQKLSDTHKGFYSAYDKNNEDNMTKVFWCDAQARKNYALFGDTISYDPTYGTNKYCMVFTPFTGVDNHEKSVTFDASLLSNEDEQSFWWAFTKFLIAMVNKEPQSILTDQDPAIKNVVLAVFKQAHHRFCVWHIMQKLTDKVGQTIFKEPSVRYGQQCLNEASGSSLPQTITPLEIEKNASTIFTHAVFYEFQEEVKASVCACNIVAFRKDMNVETTDITDAEKGKTFTVVYNCATYNAMFSCKLFEQKGLQCRHIIRVYSGKRLKMISEKYIMGRWTKNVYKKPIYDANGDLMEEYDVTDIKKIELSNVWSEFYDTVSVVRTKSESEMRELDELLKRFRSKINPGETSLTKDQEMQMLLGCTAPS